jgi:hypothetical protein
VGVPPALTHAMRRLQPRLLSASGRLSPRSTAEPTLHRGGLRLRLVYVQAERGPAKPIADAGVRESLLAAVSGVSRVRESP